jgi:uncharacterized membrane protein
MKIRLLNIWDRFSGSFWLLPTVMVVSAAVLGLVVPAVEADYFERLGDVAWLATTPQGARTVLSAIAGAMITVSGVIFSVTMATMSIAASQFGSRVLRQSMRNRATQLALGAFLGTSVFCFLVLRNIEPIDGQTFVPHVSVALGIAAAVASVFVLIYFIHDVAEAVQSPYVAARLAVDLNDSIDRLYPEQLGHEDADFDPMVRMELDLPRTAPDCVIRSDREGYL